eukprot:Lithocolla_globosa_v1_NODE_1437_length_2575_cov_16.751587.p3 type:complete len:101 gc:universal NODE_1437_length_2575_cov_16.751587:1645-1947(+)
MNLKEIGWTNISQKIRGMPNGFFTLLSPGSSPETTGTSCKDIPNTLARCSFMVEGRQFTRRNVSDQRRPKSVYTSPSTGKRCKPIGEKLHPKRNSLEENI